MSDEIFGSQPLSIDLAAQPSSSDDLAVLAGPREERRDCEQLGQRQVINGIHSPIFGHQGGRGKGRPISGKVRCVEGRAAQTKGVCTEAGTPLSIEARS